jgi:hypothetical protein
MGNPIHNGALLTIQPGEFSSDPRQGWKQTVTARGTTASAFNLSIALRASGYMVKYKNLGGGVGEVSYELNSLQNNPEVPQDLWQLPGSVMQKSIYEHPKSIALDLAYPGLFSYMQKADPLSAATILANNAADIKAGAALTPPVTIAALNSAFQSDANWLAMVALINKSSDHFDYARYGLRHTQTISQVYTGNINDTNSENLYTTAQLLAECATFPIPLPARMIAKINAIEASATAAGAAPAGYIWSWKKAPSTENMVADNKIEVTTDFEYDLWSTYLYAAYGTGSPEV